MFTKPELGDNVGLETEFPGLSEASLAIDLVPWSGASLPCFAS